MDHVWEWMEHQGAIKAAPQISAVGRARQEKKTDIEHIKNVMKNSSMSFIEAARLLGISESKWDMYRKIVEKDK